VHEIAQREDPECRVVYVDRDPIAFDQPVGLLFLLVLHWIPDEADPAALVARYRSAITLGSYLAVTHMTDDIQEDKISTVAGIARGRFSPAPAP